MTPSHSHRARAAASPLRRRAGFSIIELLVAITILGIALSSLARLTVTVSQRGRSNDLAAKRTFVLQQQANLVGAIPYVRLASLPASKSFGGTDFPFTRRVTITTGSQYSTIRVVIVPSRDTIRKDSLVINRSNPAGSPLCQGC
jgi:prepilin-type N-terminal cleavage/methylation domain-containing protein